MSPSLPSHSGNLLNGNSEPVVTENNVRVKLSGKSGLTQTATMDKMRLRHRLGAGGSFTKVRTFVICLSLLQLVQVMGSGYVWNLNVEGGWKPFLYLAPS